MLTGNLGIIISALLKRLRRSRRSLTWQCLLKWSELLGRRLADERRPRRPRPLLGRLRDARHQNCGAPAPGGRGRRRARQQRRHGAEVRRRARQRRRRGVPARARRGRSRGRAPLDLSVRRGHGGPRDVHEPVAAERRRGVGRRRLVVILTIFTYSVGPVLHEALVEPHVPGEVPAPFVVAFVKQTR